MITEMYIMATFPHLFTLDEHVTFFVLESA